MDRADALLAYWDGNQMCRFANAAHWTWFGKTPEEIVGGTMEELLGPSYHKDLPHIVAALNGQAQVFEQEFTLPDGSIRQCLASYYPDIVDGVTAGFSAQMVDVTRLKQLERELQEEKVRAERLATHDFLTGLPNRELVADAISAAISQTQRSGTLAAVAILDLDSLRGINNSYGHDAGDAVLKEIAGRLKRVLRATDTVLRNGGDEFVLVVSECESEAGLRHALDRLMDEATLPLTSLWHPLAITFSCGVAFYPANGSTADELLPAANNALYVAKRQGRNQIAFAK